MINKKSGLFFVLVLLATVAAFIYTRGVTAGRGFSDTWNVYGTDGKSAGSAQAVGSDVATFTFPTTASKSGSASFLTTVSVPNLIGNLTGKTLSATMSVSVSGNPVFRYGGQGAWNNCNVPANTRFYFTTKNTVYNLNDASKDETNYWWSNPVSATINAQLNNVTISDKLDPANWSDANGHFGSDPKYTAGFNAAVQNVQQIGLSFGGGCFFDVGIRVLSNTGTAVFHLQNYNVN